MMKNREHERSIPAGPGRLRGMLLLMALLSVDSRCLAQPDASISYVGQFGSRGRSGPPAGQFDAPHDISADAQGRLLITDWGNSRIQRCSDAGQCEVAIGPLPGRPKDLVVDSDNRIIFTMDDTIRVCESDGSCPTLWGGPGSNPGAFNDPRGVALDSRGRIVIADRYNDRFQLCNYAGSCTAFGAFNSGPDAVPGEFWEPASVATDRRGTIIVGELGDEVISVCDVSGRCSKRIGREGAAVGEFKTPTGVGLTSRGDLVVVELSNTRVQLCDLQGSCIAYGQQGTGNGQFRDPRGVHVDASDRIYIADMGNHRIQILQITYHSDPPPPQFQINPGLNDAWYNPATPGQGVLLTVLPDSGSLFLAWFTYDTERPPPDVPALLGDAGHRWLTAQGPYDGDTARLTAYLTEGGLFDAAEPPAQTDPGGAGTITVEFADCNTALLSYDLPDPGRVGEIPLQRITSDNVALCEQMAAMAATGGE